MALPVNGRQAATMSREATEFLQNQPSLVMPAAAYKEIASPPQVPTFRAQFQAQEDVIEEKLVADHGLRVEHDTGCTTSLPA